MAQLTLVNSVSTGVATSAEFRVFQGSTQLARVGVHAGGSATVTVSPSYTVTATTTLANFTLASNLLTVSDSSAQVVAQVSNDNGSYSLQLTQSSGTASSAITLQNSWNKTMQFTVTPADGSVTLSIPVAAGTSGYISTVAQLQCYAVVNGVTTSTVSTESTSVTLNLNADSSGSSYTLTAS